MNQIKPCAVLLLLYCLFYLLPLDSRALWQPDELRYAEISREMLATGDFTVPQFMGLRYFEKPVAGYWINTLSQALFGQNNFAVRLGSVFSTSVSALLVCWLASRMQFDRKIVIFAALIYLSCFLVYAIGTYSVLDPMLALWMTAAMLAFWLACQAQQLHGKLCGYLLLGVVCGMGTLSKGFPALVVPAISVLPWVIVTGRWRELLTFGPVAIAAALLTILPWAIAINNREPDFWRYFIRIEHIQRFADSNAQHKSPVWFYLPVLLAGTLPWAGFLPAALKAGWQQRRQRHAAIYLLGWVLMPLLFFSISRGKLPTYILPCFAPLSILLAWVACRSAPQNRRSAIANGWINLLAGLGAAVTLSIVQMLPGIALFTAGEYREFLLALLACLGWATAGGLALKRAESRWPLAVLCPLVLALTIAYAVPAAIRDAKQPQNFLTNIGPRLADSRYILAGSTALASGIAWQLQRTDIDLYDQPGELAYGLSRPEGRNRLITRQQFPAWLEAHRQQRVSLILMLPAGESLSRISLPTPDFMFRQGRLILLEYGPQP